MEYLKNSPILPDSWVNVEWSDITALDGFRRGPFGGNLKKSCFVEEGYSVYEQYSPINDDCTTFRYFIDEEKYSELSGFHVNQGDFLISCSGTMGRITHVPIGAPSGVINQALLRIRLQDQFILPDYFLKLFRSPLIQNSVLNKTVGGAIQNLAAVKELKTIPLPIAPLSEQKRIVEKLDSLLAQVDTIQQRLNNLPNIIKRFRQSVLAAAVSGKLTEQWRSENWEEVKPLYSTLLEKNTHKPKPYVSSEPNSLIPSNWVWSRLGDIFVLKSGKSVKATEELAEGDFPFFKVGDMNHSLNTLLMSHTEKFVSEAVIGKNGKFPEGSIVFPKRGGAIATNKKRILKQESLVDLNTMAIITPKEVDKLYVFRWLQTIDLGQLNTGSTIPQVNNGDIEPLWFPLAPLKEQTEIVRLVEQYFALADTLEKNLTNAKKRVDNLTQSILAKAFRGELVPQDPNDEPAEQLLERIKTAREEAEALAKATKKVAKAKKK